MHANFPSRQTNININFWLVAVVVVVVVGMGGGGGGGGRGSTLMFWAGLSNVTQEPLAFTTPCSAAILLL